VEKFRDVTHLAPNTVYISAKTLNFKPMFKSFFVTKSVEGTTVFSAYKNFRAQHPKGKNIAV